MWVRDTANSAPMPEGADQHRLAGPVHRAAFASVLVPWALTVMGEAEAFRRAFAQLNPIKGRRAPRVTGGDARSSRAARKRKLAR